MKLAILSDLIGGLVRPGLPDLPELCAQRLSGAAGAASSQLAKGCGSFVGGEGRTDAELEVGLVPKGL
ncbi:Centromere Protein F [Manis pentadactyla]|nr:Centromere Protein F [Manis pentadactyla]